MVGVIGFSLYWKNVYPYSIYWYFITCLRFRSQYWHLIVILSSGCLISWSFEFKGIFEIWKEIYTTGIRQFKTRNTEDFYFHVITLGFLDEHCTWNLSSHTCTGFLNKMDEWNIVHICNLIILLYSYQNLYYNLYSYEWKHKWLPVHILWTVINVDMPFLYFWSVQHYIYTLDWK